MRRSGSRRRASTDGAPDLRTLAHVLPDLWPRGRATLIENCA